MIYNLPYNITVETTPLVDGCAGKFISSDLSKEIGKKSANAIESFLLALACEGVDLNQPAFSEALKTACEAIANNS